MYSVKLAVKNMFDVKKYLLVLLSAKLAFKNMFDVKLAVKNM